MSYSLNSVALGTYDIKPGRIPGSSIAVSGIFDLPKRLGTTYQTWDDEDGIEPFVDDGEIFLGGRDVKFKGLIYGDKNHVISRISRLKEDVSAFTDLVAFSTDFGSYNVKVSKIDSNIIDGVGVVNINMREPNPDLTGGTLPASGSGAYLVDQIPLQSFGLYVSKIMGRGDQSGFHKENFTVYNQEGYQLNGRKPVDVKINGFLKASSVSEFQTNIKALWKLFIEPGLRKVRLNDYVTIQGFVTEGFTVNNVLVNPGVIIADINLKIINVSEFLTAYQHADTSGKILTTEEGKILIYG